MIFDAIVNCARLAVRGEWSMLRYVLSTRWHGLDFGFADIDQLHLSADRSRPHVQSLGPPLERVLQTLPISESDSVLDIGCGKGAAMLTLARYPFGRVDGVEISEELIAVANENLRRMRATKSTIFHSDAAQFDGYDRYTFYYMFNPFPQPVMAETMARIAASLEHRPRRVTLVYTNPKDAAVVESNGFVRIAEFESKAGEGPPTHVFVSRS